MRKKEGIVKNKEVIERNREESLMKAGRMEEKVEGMKMKKITRKEGRGGGPKK